MSIRHFKALFMHLHHSAKRAASFNRRRFFVKMTSTSAKTSHLERTAAEPRDKSLNTVKIGKIDQINETIRLLRLEIPASGPPVQFLPGQWLDVFVPGISKAGGFTITSSPSKARLATNPLEGTPGHLELAIQKSPDNPPAAWLWKEPPSSIIGKELQVRVGGSFVWPPPGINARTLKRVVFVAGGVGVNPLVSMLSDIAENGSAGFEVRFLYSVKDPGEGKRDVAQMLFVERLQQVFESGQVKGKLQLHLTGGTEESGTLKCGGSDIAFVGRRIKTEDLEEAVGEQAERKFAVAYVCGVPTMTDGFVEELTGKGGLSMAPHTVLCEKWW